MHRRAFAVSSLLMAVAIATGACAPASPGIEDPSEILAKAVESLGDAKTVHLEAGVEGKINFDPTGLGGGEITLGGTELTADVDLENSNLAAKVEIPAMLGLTAEVIVLDDETFTRTSLSGNKFMRSPLTDVGLPVDPVASLDVLVAFLERPEISPEKLGDASCGSESCYQVKVDLSTADLQALVPQGVVNFSDAQVIITVLVERDSLRPASFVIQAGATEMGELTITLTLSKWDESLSISAPPADQIQ
jgi:hypothetical protein